MVTQSALIPILFAVALGVATIWQIYVFRLANASATWRRTEGLVLNAYFDERRSYDEDGRDDQYNDTFSANVHYRYSVAGKTYESTRLWYRATWLRSFAAATDALRGVHKGKPVVVYYDPHNPARSVLITGSDVDNIIGIVTCIAGWIVLVYLYQ